MKPHRGTLILVLAIGSLLFCGFFTGIPAWIMANADLKEMDAGGMDPSGRGTTQAGKVCGIIGTLLSALSIVVVIAIIAFFGFAALSHAR
jgi:hypothetical protein